MSCAPNCIGARAPLSRAVLSIRFVVMGLFDRVKGAFRKTREVFGERIAAVFRPGRPLDDALLSELEEILLTSDVGMDTAEVLTARLVAANKEDGGRTPADVLMRRVITQWLKESEGPV